MSFDVSHSVPKDGYGQYYATTCWYSSYRMLHAWKQADQSAIKSKLAGAGLDLKRLWTRGLLDTEFRAAAAALGMCGWRGSWVRDQNAEMISHVLKRYGPLWAAMDWRGDAAAGHAVVIVAYDKKSEVFKIHNPYNRFQPGMVEVEWLKPQAVKDWIHDCRFALQAWS